MLCDNLTNPSVTRAVWSLRPPAHCSVKTLPTSGMPSAHLSAYFWYQYRCFYLGTYIGEKVHNTGTLQGMCLYPTSTLSQIYVLDGYKTTYPSIYLVGRWQVGGWVDNGWCSSSKVKSRQRPPRSSSCCCCWPAPPAHLLDRAWFYCKPVTNKYLAVNKYPISFLSPDWSLSRN